MGTTEKLLLALNKAEADIIEIGIPFSDPIAEGPAIEAASERALKQGCTVDMLFDVVGRVRGEINAAIMFMTYYNPVYAYGIEKFTARAQACGIDGLIVPDLPFEERDELLMPCKNSGLELISLIAPTSENRIDHIAKNSTGFLYCMGVANVDGGIDSTSQNMISRAKVASDIPCCMGLDITNAGQVKALAQCADGLIVRDAIVKLVEQYGEDSAPHVYKFAKEIREVI